MVQRPGSLLFIALAFAVLRYDVLGFAIQRQGSHRLPSTVLLSVLSNSVEASRVSCPIDGNPDNDTDNDNRNKKLTFSIVPASTNPSNKLTKQLLEDVLPNKLNGTDAKLLDETNGGRLSFCLPAHTIATADGPKLGQILSQKLSPYGVKSLRLVVCECQLPEEVDLPDENENTSPSLDNRQDAILTEIEANLPRAELPWNVYHESFGNAPPTCSFDKSQQLRSINLQISCRRWASARSISKKEFSSTKMKHALKKLLLQTYQGKKSLEWLEGCEFTLLLFNNKIRLEWTVLVPPKSKKFSDVDYLPKPGCKRVEAWMLMKNLEQKVLMKSKKDSAIVLDPLCGKGTFLVEAATTWDMDANDGVSVSFVGVDASMDQLRHAQMNVDVIADGDTVEDDGDGNEQKSNGSENDCVLVTKQWSHDQKSTLSLYKGDSRDLSLFEDGSVTAIATCPPFGRQFFALQNTTESEDSHTKNNVEESLATSYRDWLREWTRILDPQHGRIALLVDMDHQKQALDAIASTGAFHITVLREPFRLGRIQATVIIADAIHGTTKGTAKSISDPLSRFPWEGTAKEARAEWTRLRAASLQGLEPYSRV